MWAKVLTNVILSVLSSLASKLTGAVMAYLERRKRLKESQDVARRIENAKSPEEIRASVDDLP